MHLPASFIDSIKNVPGFTEGEFVKAHDVTEQLTSIRVNPMKPGLLQMEDNFQQKVPWSSNGYYLNQRPEFTLDPAFHAGGYYVQEASSMFLEQALRQTVDLQKDITVLDLCAAPGGKSTLIQSIISANSLLVSNEVIKSRANILAENITKWGAANVVVTNNDPKDFKRLPSFFDCIVIDAPCSGSGMFRKDPEAIDEWSLNNVQLCCQRQQRILAGVMDSLKPGGTLIYSTCSYSVEEDEDISDWLMDHYDLENFQLQKGDYGIVESRSSKHGCFGYRFYPGKVRGEGFFIAVFKKSSGEIIFQTDKSGKKKNDLATKAEEQEAGKFLKNGQDFNFFKWQNDMLAIPKANWAKFLKLQQALYIKKAGINMGSMARNELIPSHELVISSHYAGAFGAIVVDELTALDYLRRKDIILDTTIRGWTVLVYNELVLGLVKILPNRINNYYPKEWRILNK